MVRLGNFIKLSILHIFNIIILPPILVFLYLYLILRPAKMNEYFISLDVMITRYWGKAKK
jgi:hypothetical protein